ncbi:hypothetical protein DNTS_004759 [Danionella cerebrum]|uniref:Syndecan n=1 Tax=Danionella cerebrum TaxID=2873325 RepID=A0A553NN11_9TELE|nr:hypothetical protein DNTS_004759 [Danionella translucida]
MLKVYLMLVLSAAAAVFAESVRETETWVPQKNKAPHEDLESSGDSQNEDFEFADLDPTDDEDGFDEEDDTDDFSGSGDSEEVEETEYEDEINNNMVPDDKSSFVPDLKVETTLLENNEVMVHPPPNLDSEQGNNVQMTLAGEESLFNNTEVLAAVIAGGAVGLVFAILLIVLLVHFVFRIKKKDEGSYDLGKTPIYKKAPTTEIYA